MNTVEAQAGKPSGATATVLVAALTISLLAVGLVAPPSRAAAASAASVLRRHDAGTDAAVPMLNPTPSSAGWSEPAPAAGVTRSKASARRAASAAAAVEVSHFVVDDDGDAGDGDLSDGLCDDGSGNCTLRAAIEQLDKLDATTPSVITFALTGTFVVPTLLPDVTAPVIIDGGGAVTIQGAPTVPLGFEIHAPDSSITGIGLGGFGVCGIRLGGDRDSVVGSMIGMDVAGTKKLPIGTHADRAVRGGCGITVAARSEISGVEVRGNYIGNVENGPGLGVASSAGTRVTRNRFGVAGDGVTPMPNYLGIETSKTKDQPLAPPRDLMIGGTEPDDANLVANSIDDGILISSYGYDVSGDGDYSVHVEGNTIGLAADGTLAGNANGVVVDRIPHVKIGVERRNIIAGSHTVDGNPVSGMGIGLFGATASGAVIENNYIGTDSAGSNAMGNVVGIEFGAVADDTDIPGNVTIGQGIATGNLISGNTANGIDLRGPGGNGVTGNWIGADPTSARTLPNKGFGIRVSGSPMNLIGGVTPGAGNVIVGDMAGGILIDGSEGKAATGNEVVGNWIGVLPAGEKLGSAWTSPPSGWTALGVGRAGAADDDAIGNGITVRTANATVIGYAADQTPVTDCTGPCNHISAAGQDGVAVVGGARGTTIRGNAIVDNGALGIALIAGPAFRDQPLPNDEGDADAGPNGLLNTPAMVMSITEPDTPVFETTRGKVLVTGSLRGQATVDPATVSVDVYGSTSEDLTRSHQFPGLVNSHGEAPTWLGVATVTADGRFYLPLDKTTARRYDAFSATLTTADGNTSEVSPVCLPEAGSHSGDQDADGICDQWERSGLDFDDDGLVDVDLPSYDAHTDRKDVYLEVDAESGYAPSPRALDTVAAAFAVHDIDLHITASTDRGNSVDQTLSASAISSAGLDPRNLADSDITRARSTWLGSRSDSSVVKAAKSSIWHYALFVQQLQQGAAGEMVLGAAAGIPGNVLVVGTGILRRSDVEAAGGRGFNECAAYAACLQQVQEGVLMHELGHELGLGHGGGDHVNYKPNYLSVMNYSFTHQDLVVRPLDYSDFDSSRVPDIDTDHMSEIDPFRGWDGTAKSAWPETVWRTGTPELCIPVPQRTNSPNVDWNLNNNIDAGTVHAFVHDCATGEVLQSFDDLGGLQLSPSYIHNFVTAGAGRAASDMEQFPGIEATASAVDTDADGVDNWHDNCPFLANADQTDADTDGIGDACAARITARDLQVSVDADTTQVSPGESHTVTVHLANNYPGVATGDKVLVTLPDGATVTTSDAPAGTTFDGATWTIPTLASHGSDTLTLTYTVGSDFVGGDAAAEVTAAGQDDPTSTPGNHNAAEDDQGSVTLSFVPKVLPTDVTAFASPSSTVPAGASATLTARVTSAAGFASPTGTVTFVGNSGSGAPRTLGSAALSPAGVDTAPDGTSLAVALATLTVDGLDPGNHAIAVQYGGDDLHAPAQAATIVQALTVDAAWSGGGDGRTWSDPGNWQHAAVPTSGATVLIASVDPLATQDDLPGLALAHVFLSGPVTIAGQTLTLNGGLDAAGPAAVTNGIVLSDGTHDVTATGDLRLTGQISGPGGLRILNDRPAGTDPVARYTDAATFTGGRVELGGTEPNTYGGGTVIGSPQRDGRVLALGTGALGPGDHGATITLNGALCLASGTTLDEPVSAHGGQLDLAPACGAPDAGDADQTPAPAPVVRGSIVDETGLTLGCAPPDTPTAPALVVAAPIGGPGGVTICPRAVVTYAGHSANTYRGRTRIPVVYDDSERHLVGSLTLAKDDGVIALPGSLNDRAEGPNSSRLILAADGQTSADADVFVDRLDLGAHRASVRTLTANRLTFTVDGATAHGQLHVDRAMNAPLSADQVTITADAPVGSSVILIDNATADPIGHCADSSTVPGAGIADYRLDCSGGDGNDVALSVIWHTKATITVVPDWAVAAGQSVTVTVKVSAPVSAPTPTGQVRLQPYGFSAPCHNGLNEWCATGTPMTATLSGGTAALQLPIDKAMALLVSYDGDGIHGPAAVPLRRLTTATEGGDPPGAPTITDTSTTTDGATIIWDPPANDGGNPVLGYEVRAVPDRGGPVTVADTNALSPYTGTGVYAGRYIGPDLFPDVRYLGLSGLSPATTYSVTVTAVTARGAGPASGSATVTTGNGTPSVTVPSAPTALNATAAPGGAFLSWTAPTSPGDSPIQHYVITVHSGGAAQRTIDTTGAATSVSIGGLQPGTTYTFTVAAVNLAGRGPDSAASDPVIPTAVTPVTTVPDRPEEVRAEVTARTGDGTSSVETIKVSWATPADGGTPLRSLVVIGHRRRWQSGNTAIDVSDTLRWTVPAGQTSTTVQLPGITPESLGGGFWQSSWPYDSGSISFTVQATNAVGAGPESDASSTLPLAWDPPDPDGGHTGPLCPTGGEPPLCAVYPPGSPNGDISNNVIAGGAADLAVDGFGAGETVGAWLHSTPRFAGSVYADAGGLARMHLLVPADLPPGPHTIELVGATSRHTVDIDIHVVASPTLRLTWPRTAPTYGQAFSVRADVTARGAAPSGTVTVSEGQRALARATIRGGSVTLTLSGTALRPGTHHLTVTYSGSSTVAGAATSQTLTVVRARSQTGLRLARPRISHAARAMVTITVTSRGTTPAGKVWVYDGGKRIASGGLSRTGAVTIRLPRLKRGAHKVYAVYAGSGLVDPSTSATRSIRVR